MNQTNQAVFFLSTGRCGTQWLHKTLSAEYFDVAEVTHEAVRSPYNAKRYLRAHDKFDELLSSRHISPYLARIRETLKTKTYIETGWTVYAILPFMIEQLEGRVRIVHLVRHPVFTSLSVATHQIHERHDWIKDFVVTPFDEGTVQKELSSSWHKMNSYEKSLFWWTEMHLYALELKAQYPGVEFFFLRYEDLFGEGAETTRSLVEYMGLDYKPAIQTHKMESVDAYKFKSDAMDWSAIFSYPRTIALAKYFDYDLDHIPLPNLSKRYFERGIIDHVVRAVTWISQRLQKTR